MLIKIGFSCLYITFNYIDVPFNIKNNALYVPLYWTLRSIAIFEAKRNGGTHFVLYLSTTSVSTATRPAFHGHLHSFNHNRNCII